MSAEIILRPSSSSNDNITRRNVIPKINAEAGENDADNVIDEEESRSRSQFFKKKRAFNIFKHVVSIVFIFLDVAFDWVAFSEMITGNFTLSTEKQVGDIKFTHECEGTGNTVKTIYIVVTVVGTIFSLVQTALICYQIYGEVRNIKVKDSVINEYVEAFLFLFFVKIFQVVLIMGFVNVCSFECEIDLFEIVASLNIGISISRISWRVATSFTCCSIQEDRIPTTRERRRKRTDNILNCSRFECCSIQENRIQSPRERRIQQTEKVTCCSTFSFYFFQGCNSFLEYCKWPLLILFAPLWLPFLPFYCIALMIEDCSIDDCEKPLMILLAPLWLPFLPIYCLITKCCMEKRTPVVPSDEREETPFKCERSLCCCIGRCYPSRFETPNTEACECICGKCLSCEQYCKCFTCRCFPSYLKPPESDIWTCLCGQCLASERNCKCFTCRCCPSYLDPPESEIWTCLCGQCMASERNCKCFTCRCCPSYLNPPASDIWTCLCGQCLAFERNCKCFTCRCCPSYLDPPKSDILTCLCGQCLAFEQKCKCFICRCCPSYLDPPKSDIWTCLCGQCLVCEQNCKCFTCRCCPSYLDPPMSDTWTCLCKECMKCEQAICCCCVLRCFPSLVDSDENLTCLLPKYLACEQNLCCCVVRCFPSKMENPEENIFEHRCGNLLICRDCHCSKPSCHNIFMCRGCHYSKPPCYKNLICRDCHCRKPTRDNFFICCNCPNCKSAIVAPAAEPEPVVRQPLPIPTISQHLESSIPKPSFQNVIVTQPEHPQTPPHVSKPTPNCSNCKCTCCDNFFTCRDQQCSTPTCPCTCSTQCKKYLAIVVKTLTLLLYLLYLIFVIFLIILLFECEVEVNMAPNIISSFTDLLK